MALGLGAQLHSGLLTWLCVDLVLHVVVGALPRPGLPVCGGALRPPRRMHGLTFFWAHVLHLRQSQVAKS